MKNIIETRQLTKEFKKHKAVNGIDLKVKEGEIYGFLGPNGAGKSTTIRLLLGLSKPTKGDIRIFQKDLKSNKSSILREVGSMVEYPSYYGNLTGYENLKVIAKLLDVNDSKRIKNTLDIVGLTDSKDKLVKNYSLGMKQRLGIGIAILRHPKLLILDEPTNGLDPAGIQEIRQLIKSLPDKYGMTVLLSSHILSEIDQMATHVGIIEKGNLIFQDDIHELRKKSTPKIKIRVSNTEFAKKLLEHDGWNIKVNTEGELLIDFVEDSKIGSLNDKLIRHHLSIYRIQEETKSIEDIFLELTGTGR